MNPGDRLEITTDETTYTGILMPRPDMLKKGILVLKLDNGYNIGIEEEKIKEKKVIEPVKDKQNPNPTPLKKNKDLPTIAILSLGGTISSSVDYTSGGVKAVSYTAQDFLNMCPEIKNFANVKAKAVMQLMSEDLDLPAISKVAKELEPWIKREDIDGLVVTLGTDCFHYITAALSFMITTNKPIIFTAAQRSIDRGSSDAFMNLACACYAAAKWGGAELVSCMHESSDDKSCILVRGNKIRKMHTSRRDAFRPINTLPFARITYPKLNIENLFDQYDKKDNKKEIKIQPNISDDVALIQVHPGINPKVIDFYVKQGIKGIVLAGTALGHVPTEGKSNLLPAIENAINKGVIIAVATQTLYGRTHPFAYTNLRKLTVKLSCIFAEDMLPETAYMKLAWLLANEKDKETVIQKFKENLKGEINPILDEKSFLY